MKSVSERKQRIFCEEEDEEEEAKTKRPRVQSIKRNVKWFLFSNHESNNSDDK